MTHSEVEQWVERYVLAWRSPGTERLAELFEPDASYLPSPWREPLSGLDEIEEFWEGARSGPDEQFEIEHEIVAVEGNKAVLKLQVEYHEPPEEWRDIWIVRFAENGKAVSFEEWPYRPWQDDGHDELE